MHPHTVQICVFKNISFFIIPPTLYFILYLDNNIKVNCSVKDLKGFFTGGKTTISKDVANGIITRYLGGEDPSKIASEFGDASKSIEKYLTSTNRKSLSDSKLMNSVNGANVTLKNFGKNILKAAGNMGVMLAASLAIEGAIYIFDKVNITAEEQQEIVDELTGKVESLKNEYDELNGKSNRTSAENKHLGYLERQLDYQERLLKIEQQRLVLSQLFGVGDALSDGDLVYGGDADTAKSNIEGIAQTAKNDIQYLNDLRKQIADTDKNSSEYIKLVQQEADYMASMGSYRDSAIQQYTKYASSYEMVTNALESGAFEGTAYERVLKELQAIYESGMDTLDKSIVSYDAALGDSTAAIEERLSQIGQGGNVDLTNRPVIDAKELAKKGWTDAGEGSATVYTSTYSNKDGTKAINFTPIIVDKNGNYVGVLTPEELENYANEVLNGADDYRNLQIGAVFEGENAIIDAESVANETHNLHENYYELKDDIESSPIEISVEGDIKNLSTASDELKAFHAIYKDVADGEGFDYNSLIDAGFAEKFKGYTKEYDNFLKVISNSPNDINKCQQAFNDLATAYFYDSEALKNITEDNYDATVAWLEQEGALNAVEVANYALAQAKASAWLASQDLTKITDESIVKFAQENSAIGVTRDMLYQLQIQMIQTNNQGLDFSQQITALKTLAVNAGVAAELVSKANQRKVARQAERSGMSTVDYLAQNISSAINNAVTKVDYAAPVGGGKSGGGSSSDPYQADIDKFKDLSDAVEDVELKITHLNQAYEHTDDISEQIALQDKLIGLYQEQKDALDALNNARDKEIANKVAELRAGGFNVTYDPKTDHLKINNIERLNTLSEDQIKKYEKIIDETYELNDANKDSAEQWTELSYSILETKKSIEELEKKHFDSTIDDIEILIDLLNDSESTMGDSIAHYEDLMIRSLKRLGQLAKDDFEGKKDEIKALMKAYMSYYEARIEKEIEIKELEQEDQDSVLSAINDLLDERAKKIDEEIDALNKANEERREALDLQKAQAALDKANSQKTRRVLRKGLGFIYEADEDAIREAEEALSDLRYEETISKLEEQKEALEKLQEKWSEIPELFEKYQNALIAEQLLGADWESDILNDRIDVYKDFKDNYFDIQQDIFDLTEELNKKTNESYQQTMKLFQAMMQMYIAMDDAALHAGQSGQTTRKHWYVQRDGKAPSQAQVGDYIYTKGGTYRIDAKDENGKFTSTKIDNKYTTPPSDNLWGTAFKTETVELTGALYNNSKKTQDIIDTAEKHIDTNPQYYW